jgi:hypothetical protein
MPAAGQNAHCLQWCGEVKSVSEIAVAFSIQHWNSPGAVHGTVHGNK